MNEEYSIEEELEEVMKNNKELKEEVDKLNYIIEKQDRDIANLSKENQEQKEVIAKAIKELFNLKDMIYRPETREENIEIQRKISSIITSLKSNNRWYK